MGKATYIISGQIEGSDWEDFVSDYGPSITIKKGDVNSISDPDEDGWYDVVLADFSKENIIHVLEDISKKEVVLVENKECMSV